MIQTLIDKQDNSEILRDQIAAILALETAAQQVKATQAAKDPQAWRLRVYAERSNPWENAPDDYAPVVNVWFEKSEVNPRASDTVERQTYSGMFNIDVYGFGLSRPNGAGHVPGDEDAAKEAQRGVRLVRNIVMASVYTYLGLRGVVARRMVDAVTIFQPQASADNVAQVVGARVSLRVDFLEFAPQYVGEPLEVLFAKVHRAEDGQIIINAEYNYL
jgi:hypothetical protein